jgi:hypothetical protein
MRMSQAIIQFENKLHKDEPLRKTIEKLKEVLIKKGKKKYFITIACPRRLTRIEEALADHPCHRAG